MYRIKFLETVEIIGQKLGNDLKLSLYESIEIFQWPQR